MCFLRGLLFFTVVVVVLGGYCFVWRRGEARWFGFYFDVGQQFCRSDLYTILVIMFLGVFRCYCRILLTCNDCPDTANLLQG